MKKLIGLILIMALSITIGIIAEHEYIWNSDELRKIGLYGVAAFKILDLQQFNIWSHNISTDNFSIPTSENFTNRIVATDLDGYNDHGEILYKGLCDVSIATIMWNDSPKHAAIMHNQDYKDMVMLMKVSNFDKNICYIVGEYRK